ncbi:MAG: type I-C CRISPR-associated protein Cas8c/Csd1 [Candidatus Omnitrophica bacterium]|nr:type I-C CRISPR-associated protein Cas8c/Csd1 [Candidatus Omnitrophota bacterium]
MIRLSNHHIKKAGDIAEDRISEIMEHINEFPSQMSLQQQGLFAIAYYQQKNAF